MEIAQAKLKDHRKLSGHHTPNGQPTGLEGRHRQETLIRQGCPILTGLQALNARLEKNARQEPIVHHETIVREITRRIETNVAIGGPTIPTDRRLLLRLATFHNPPKTSEAMVQTRTMTTM